MRCGGRLFAGCSLAPPICLLPATGTGKLREPCKDTEMIHHFDHRAVYRTRHYTCLDMHAVWISACCLSPVSQDVGRCIESDMNYGMVQERRALFVSNKATGLCELACFVCSLHGQIQQQQ